MYVCLPLEPPSYPHPMPPLWVVTRHPVERPIWQLPTSEVFEITAGAEGRPDTARISKTSVALVLARVSSVQAKIKSRAKALKVVITNSDLQIQS